MRPVFSRPSHPIQPWTSRPDPPASLSSLATGFSARAKLCGLSLGRLSLAVCPPLSSLATGFSARACAPTPAWPKLCGLSRMSSLQPAAHALISDLWRPTTGLGVVGVPSCLLCPMPADTEALEGVVAPSHVIAASDTNTYADPNTAMPSNDDASVSAPPEHASSPPILPDTSSRDAFLDSALPMPNSPPLHVPTLALPLNTALEAMETSTLGAHQLFDNDDNMDIDYEASTSAPERYVVRLPKRPSEYISPPPSKRARRTSDAEQKDEPYERRQWRKRRRVLRRITAWVEGLSEQEEDEHPGLGVTAVDYDADPESEELEITESEFEARLMDLQGPDSGDEERLSLSDEEEDHNPFDVTADNSDREGPVSEDEDEDALDIEMPADRAFVASNDEDNGDSIDFYLRANAMVMRAEDDVPSPIIEESKRSKKPKSKRARSSSPKSESTRARSSSPKPKSKKVPARAAPPAVVLSFLDLAAKDSDGEEDDKGENSVAGDFIVDDQPFNVNDQNLYKIDDDDEEPFDGLVDELQLQQDQEQRKRRQRRYAQDLQQEHQREQRRQGLSSSLAAYPEEDVDPQLGQNIRKVMREVRPNDPAFAEDPKPKHPLVRKGDWVLLEQDPRVVAYVLDDSARRFVVANIVVENKTENPENETENQTENPKGLRIRTKRKPVTCKAAPVVHPTADDLRPFKSAHLRFAKPYWGRTSYALSPGDRAFVVDGPHCKFSGLVDHLLKNEHGEFVAVLVGWPSETPHPTISQLRQHLLDPGPVPRICDRVLVVDGPYRDEVATIESIEGHIIRIGNPSMVEPVEVEIGHVARYFLPGDSVWMAGEDQGGLLTEMQPSLGMVSILVDPKRGLMKEVPQSEIHFNWSDYPGSWTRITPWGPLTEQDHEREELKLRALIDDAYKLMKSEKKSAPGGITSRRKLMAMAKAEHAYRQNRWWDAVQELKVATDLELEDDEHITRRLVAVISARANGALKKTREHSEDLTDFNRKMMKTGLRFEGLEVKIIAPNYGSRTLKGIITGDHDSEARRQREKLNNAKELLRLCRHDLEGILATVSYDKHAPVENVPIEYIVEWETQIPLSRAVYVKHGWNSRTFQLPESLPPAPALPPARPLTPPPDPSSSLLPFELPGETDGSWLYQGNRFVGKCLEVVVHITARTKGTRKLTIRDTQKSKEGMGGFLLVATEYTKDSVMTVYGLPPSGVPVKFTGSCLAPSRAHSDGVRVDERMNEGVVIIGEDSLHDVSHIGQYGLVVDKLPPEHAVVQHEDHSRHQYHWKSLCLSTNKERYQGETSFPATIF
ncbi:hypothetical protein FB45DRAFT_1033123 [Roridomyces roridus]|uniref:KOW domain-containing protein n=1 Tax=Roridomyces roridus TaxID=1738132 RepID=A0AAD7BGU1_9AGAR|nr:hypothetical protein FB45DRAFT_1033123 [Roridomyces roridus]